MENPYWFSEGRTHHIDLESIRRVCFGLLNIFGASQILSGEFKHAEIEEGQHQDQSASTLLVLHQELAESQISQLLLQLALMLRTYDDIIAGSDAAGAYQVHRETTSGSDYIGAISEGRFDLREACNKVIHATEIRPLFERIDRTVAHSASGDVEQDIWYLTGEIELKGINRKKPWEATLHAQPFIEIALDRIAFGNPLLENNSNIAQPQ